MLTLEQQKAVTEVRNWLKQHDEVSREAYIAFVETYLDEHEVDFTVEKLIALMPWV